MVKSGTDGKYLKPDCQRSQDPETTSPAPVTCGDCCASAARPSPAAGPSPTLAPE